MKTPLLLSLLFLSVFCACAEPTAEERDLSSYFGAYSGAFVLLDGSRDHWMRYHADLCKRRVPPMSTFKILNSLIALETGVATSPEFALRWNGTKHPIDEWNRDHTLRSAFSVSCVWFFQTLAERIGAERMHEFVSATHYGNNDTSGGLTHFWLDSSLTISPDEQVDFLYRINARRLPFSARSIDNVLDIMTVSRQGTTVYRGKTGTAGDAVKQVATMGWWVGSISTDSGNYFFAANITGGENPSGQTARKITESILTDLKLLPSP
jgi:beta-lactamase class D